MKQFICLCVLSLVYISTIAQVSSIGITTDKTTSLIFPFSIRHVDRGTQDILAQQVKEADNILLVKASAKSFPETNLSVVTEDGSVYTFTVTYDPRPTIWIYNLPINTKATTASYANGILDNPKTIKGIKEKGWHMSTEVSGIYTKENISFFQIEIKNGSNVDYDIDILRFYIRDKRKSKRTAVQENELAPIYTAGNTKKIKAHQKTVIVVALERFTIPDAKYLAVQIMERNGGRHLMMKLNNKKIMRAIILPDLK